MSEHFPPTRNRASDARLLFVDWRTSLLKDDTPGPRVPITHGQSFAHWERDQAGRLCINLEDMWTEFEQSVDHLIAYLRTNAERRSIVLKRWSATVWDVAPFGSLATASTSVAATSATMTTSHPVASAISVPPAPTPQ